MREDQVFEGDWSRRRRVVFAINAYCGVGVALLAVFGNDGALHTNAMLGLIGLATSVDLGYLGLPMLDDHDRRRQFVNFRSTLPVESRASGAPTVAPAVTGRVDDAG